MCDPALVEIRADLHGSVVPIVAYDKAAGTAVTGHVYRRITKAAASIGIILIVSRRITPRRRTLHAIQGHRGAGEERMVRRTVSARGETDCRHRHQRLR